MTPRIPGTQFLMGFRITARVLTRVFARVSYRSGHSHSRNPGDWRVLVGVDPEKPDDVVRRKRGEPRRVQPPAADEHSKNAILRGLARPAAALCRQKRVVAGPKIQQVQHRHEVHLGGGVNLGLTGFRSHGRWGLEVSYRHNHVTVLGERRFRVETQLKFLERSQIYSRRVCIEGWEEGGGWVGWGTMRGNCKMEPTMRTPGRKGARAGSSLAKG